MVTVKSVQNQRGIGHAERNRHEPDIPKTRGAIWMSSPKLVLAILAALMVAAPASQAQEGQMPPEIANKLLELGRVVDPPKTVELYAPLQEKEPYHGVKIERDIKYGAADRNLLDVFMPEMASPARPV